MKVHNPLCSELGIYEELRDYLVTAGFRSEIEWQEQARLVDVTETLLLEEIGWVVLTSGFRTAAVRKCFKGVSEAFLYWESAAAIVKDRSECERRALKHFRNQRKIVAIGECCEIVERRGWRNILDGLRESGPSSLEILPYIGRVTSFHLAKNLGANVVKADRHLRRIAGILGHESPDAMCGRIAETCGERKATVDYVFWRFATLRDDYLNIVANLCK